MRFIVIVGLAVSFASALGGCLSPLTDDTPGYSEFIKTTADAIPLITEAPALASQVDANDQRAGELIALQAGWVAGRAINYWDFGTTPEFAIPVWLFRECDAAGEPIAAIPGHPNVIDAVPGDVGYTSLWKMVIVCVTGKRSNEVFPSFRALSDGVEIGLLREPRDTGVWATCPVFLPSMRLEVGSGNDPVAPEFGYYQGIETHYYHPGGMERGVFALDENGLPRFGHAFVGQLESGASCDPVFEHARDSASYSPAVKVVNVQHRSRLGCQTDYTGLVESDGDGGFRAVGTQVGEVTVVDEVRVLDIQSVAGLP